MYDLRGEREFNPPHGKTVFGVAYKDSSELSFNLLSGERVVMQGSMRFFHISCTSGTENPELVKGVFQGDYEVDDFIYPAEVHFEDTSGQIFERPRQVPECLMPDDVYETHLLLTDASGQTIAMIRDMDSPWDPTNGIAVGRIGHLLFKY